VGHAIEVEKVEVENGRIDVGYKAITKETKDSLNQRLQHSSSVPEGCSVTRKYCRPLDMNLLLLVYLHLKSLRSRSTY